MVSELAKVEGEIDVAHVVINGTVAGPVRATEYVELLPKARVTGDVSYKAIEIHVGAIVMGQLIYESAQKSEKVIELINALVALFHGVLATQKIDREPVP